MAARTGLREAPGARAPPGPAGMQRGAGQRSSRQQCTHERTHPCWRTLTHSHTHTLSMHPRSCTLTHTRSHSHTCTHAHTLTHSCTHACTHARTHAHNHAHTHSACTLTHTLRTHPGTYSGTPVQGAPPGSNAASVCMLREAGAWGLPARLGTDRRGLWWQPGATRWEDAGLCSLGRAATPPGSWGTVGYTVNPPGSWGHSGARCNTPGRRPRLQVPGPGPSLTRTQLRLPGPSQRGGSCRHAAGRRFTPPLRCSLSRACGEPAQLPAQGLAGRSARPLWGSCPTLHNPYNGRDTLTPSPQAPRVTPSSGPPSPGSGARALEPEPGLRGMALSTYFSVSRRQSSPRPRIL